MAKSRQRKQQKRQQRPKTIQQVRVGGPLLGNRPHNFKTDIPSFDQFEPIITPEITLAYKGKQQHTQRFILLPHQRFISVLAYKTGTQIASFVPKSTENEDKEDDVIIECVCLARNPEKKAKTSMKDIVDRMDIDGDEAVDNTAASSSSSSSSSILNKDLILLAGCRDGTIREFALSDLASDTSSKAFNCGPYQVPGPCYQPRRVIHASNNGPIMHITAPALPTTGSFDYVGGSLVYIAVRTRIDELSKKDAVLKEEYINISIFRLLIDLYEDGKTSISLIDRKDDNEEDSSNQSQRKTRLGDQVKCRVSRDRSGNFLNTAPFRLLSTAKRMGGGGKHHSIFIILARSSQIHVYYEQIGDSTSSFSNKRITALVFRSKDDNPLTSINISVNQKDISCGHYKGDITLMANLLSDIATYQTEMSKHSATAKVTNRGTGKEEKKPNKKVLHPQVTVIRTNVHWHSHPVTSMTFDPTSSKRDPLLYSGGEESVLVSWQISKGTDRPVDVLPRLALAGIVHVVCCSPFDTNASGDILVYAEDNSLQLIQSHNKGILWKIHGLGSNRNTYTSPSNTLIDVDPRACGSMDAPLVITGAPEAQGYIQWYDPKRQRLTDTLEVAAFNRISRAERGETPLPSPRITNHVFSEGGQSLITLDTSPSENVYIGAHENRGKGSDKEYGIITTIRFWSINTDRKDKKSPPYILIAAMTYPHGPKNRVTGLAVSKDGSMACTVSNDEKAFRLWQRVTLPVDGSTGRIPSWTCRFKVTIPAGYSNLATSTDGVSVSDDGSTLAICFGSIVTLWDAREARFLSSICHLDCSERVIDSVQFVSTGLVHDFLLVKSKDGVSLQSPFGVRGCLEEWKWVVSPESTVSVTDVTLVDSHAAVCVTVYNATTGQSRLVFIDAASGQPGIKLVDNESDKIELIDGIKTNLKSVCSVGKYEVQSAWDDGSNASSQPFVVYSLTEIGELICFRADAEDSTSTVVLEEEHTSWNMGPTLDVAGSGGTRKRRRRTLSTSLPTVDTIGTAPKRKAVEVFGLVYADEQNRSEAPATADLPTLSSNFVRSFVSRSLSRNKRS